MKPRMLVAELHHLGDAVLALPFLRGALETYNVTILCRPGVEVIFRMGLPSDAEVRTWDPPWHEESRERRRWFGAAGILRWARAGKFEVAVCVWPDPRVHLLFRLAGIPVRVGLEPDPVNFYGAHLEWRRRTMERGAALTKWIARTPLGPLLTRKVRRSSGEAHHLDGWGQIANATGTRLSLSTPWLSTEVKLPGGLVEFVDEARRGGKTICVVHPGARSELRQWGVANYETLVSGELIRRRGFRVIVVMPPGGPELSVEGTEAEGNNVIRIQPANLEELAAVMGVADVVVCNDSLAGHMGAALGKRVVSIFGPMTPDWFAPFDNRGGVVEAPVCPHRPCLDRCVMPSPICIQSVTLEMVCAKLDQFPH